MAFSLYAGGMSGKTRAFMPGAQLFPHLVRVFGTIARFFRQGVSEEQGSSAEFFNYL
jgi:hypothetical protein